jgi:hypothetical protein
LSAIYTGKCSHCSYNTGRMTSDALYLRLDTGPFVPIVHPAERYCLQGAGYTRREANLQHRLIHAQRFSCAQCGHILQKYKLNVDRSCASILITGLGAVLLPYCLLHWMRFELGMGVTLGIVFVWMWAEEGIVRWRGREQAKLLPKLRACPECSCRRFIYIRGYRRHRCPECRHKSLRFRMTGIS